MAPYRPPGRSARSGRTNADNDVFEGLPVKQWGQSFARVSLAPPASETTAGKDDKWGEPPMPRDYQLLQPWTQHLLRLARSGKVGTKRKQDAAEMDDDKPEDDLAEEETKQNSMDELRGYVAKKWKPVPEHALKPESKHLNFLARRRRGLPSLYGPDVQHGATVPMRRTKVQKADANGEIAVYEVLVPEGASIEGEITESTELADVKPVLAAPGTFIEGVGIANDEGIVVAEHLARAPRRNRPPPKKKGGPGRGKKRVTFTNPDGSTYTAIVPNATKIVPQPGQTIKHVAKGEEATADISAEEAAKQAANRAEAGGDGAGEGEEGDGSDDEDGDDDEDREEGEVSDEDMPATGNQTPAKTDLNGISQAMQDVQPTSAPEQKGSEADSAAKTEAEEPQPPRDVSSSPEMPLATNASRTGSMVDPPAMALDVSVKATESTSQPATEPAEEPTAEATLAVETVTAGKVPESQEKDDAADHDPTATKKAGEGAEDLLGDLEKSLA